MLRRRARSIPGLLVPAIAAVAACAPVAEDSAPEAVGRHGDALVWASVQEISGGDTAQNDSFAGYNAVSLRDDRILVGARNHDVPATTSGAAYVFELVGGSWTEVQKLSSSDAALGDELGRAVAISGDFAIVGASHDDDAAQNSGSAYVFERDAAGAWLEVQKISGSDAAAGNEVGFGVGLDGDWAALGAWKGPQASSGGAAYVFHRVAGIWAQTQKLVPSDAGDIDGFGVTLRLRGDRLIVGAMNEDGPIADERGAAYMFERNAGGTWIEAAKLVASDFEGDALFGIAVDVDADRAIVGADKDGPNNHGAAYVFERDGAGAWNEVAKLVASDAAASDRFGYSVTISGDRAAVAALEDDDAAPSSGSMYVFERQPGGAWVEVQKFSAPNGSSIDNLGSAISMQGQRIAVGAHGAGPTGGGSVYVVEGKENRIDGGACGAPAQCQSGFCVDGVCCDTSCGMGDPDDCQACTVAAGGSQDGACTPVAGGTECRASSAPCDAAEACDGANATCPADAVSPDGDPGSPSCSPYLCSGMKLACPVMCGDSTDCAPGYVCTLGACVPDGGSGGGGAGGAGEGGGGAGGGGGGGASGGSTSIGGAGGSGDAGAGVGGGAEGGAGDATATGSGAGGPGSDGDSEDGESGGCGCRTAPRGAPPQALWAIAVALAVAHRLTRSGLHVAARDRRASATCTHPTARGHAARGIVAMHSFHNTAIRKA